jgi:hypothetical protein
MMVGGAIVMMAIFPATVMTGFALARVVWRVAKADGTWVFGG